jgi:hypothetical protein
LELEITFSKEINAALYEERYNTIENINKLYNIPKDEIFPSLL